MKLFRHKSEHKEEKAKPAGATLPATAEGQEIAAVIAAALSLRIREMRQFENTFVTIQKVIKPYSPWSSKIYGLRQRPVCYRPHSSRTK